MSERIKEKEKEAFSQKVQKVFIFLSSAATTFISISLTRFTAEFSSSSSHAAKQNNNVIRNWHTQKKRYNV